MKKNKKSKNKKDFNNVFNSDLFNLPSVKDFIAKVLFCCAGNSIDIEFIAEKGVETSSGSVSGYFSDSERKLVVSNAKNPLKFLEILVHEFCHTQQFVQKCKEWTDLSIDKEGTTDASTLLDQWLNNYIELNQEQLYDYVFRIAAMELDCEKRTIETIKYCNLPIDIDKYIQGANAYVKSYFAIMNKRKWYIKGKSPYLNKEVMDKMPTTFIELDKDKPFTEKELKIFDWCFEND